MPFVYMIKNSDNKLYVGISKDPNKRVATHNSKQGASYTKNQKKFELVFREKYSTVSEARKREIQIKKWGRVKKILLLRDIQQDFQQKWMNFKENLCLANSQPPHTNLCQSKLNVLFI